MDLEVTFFESFLFCFGFSLDGKKVEAEKRCVFFFVGFRFLADYMTCFPQIRCEQMLAFADLIRSS